MLYPGSYIDSVPSRFYDEVTCVDMDAEAARFFSDEVRVEVLSTEY